MPDYLSHRQNAVSTEPQNIAELNSCLETLADEFGLAWLEQPGSNPVQELWQAKHAMATNELLNLGDAIRNLLQANGSLDQTPDRAHEVVRCRAKGGRHLQNPGTEPLQRTRPESDPRPR